MAFDIITGDLLQIEADAIVVPVSPNVCDGAGLGKLVYEAAGLQEIMKARKEIGRIRVGTVAVTEGLHLKCNYIIHTVTPEWNGGFTGEAKKLTDCYCEALKKADELQLKRVVFALLGAGANRTPLTIAKQIAQDTICGWLQSHQSVMEVQLVVIEHVMELIREEDAKKRKMTPFEQKWQEERENFFKKNENPIEDGFENKRMQKYLRDRISNKAEMSRRICYDAANIGKLMNGEIKTPGRRVAIALAVEMRLTKEERYDFIWCAGYSYPVDEREREIERMLESGYKSFMDINDKLTEIKQEWNYLKEKKCKKVK